MADTWPTVWFASPGDPETLTGGYIYNARVCHELKVLGWDMRAIRLPDAYPFPSPVDEVRARQDLSVVQADDLLVVDGLALGALSNDTLTSISGKLIGLVHHPLADETGLTEAQIETLTLSERTALGHAVGVVTSSSHTAEVLVARFDVPRDRIGVAVPGVERSATVSEKTHPPLLLSVGSLTARKGHDVLVKALAQLVDMPWRAVIVGTAERDPAVARDIQELISRSCLDERITLAGEVLPINLGRYYQSASVFVLATRHEGYGMVFSEAMAHGLPIVSCAAGAVPDTVPEAAGVLVPPDDPEEFADALRRVLRDPQLYQRLADGSKAASTRLPSWKDAALSFGEKLQEVARL